MCLQTNPLQENLPLTLGIEVPPAHFWIHGPQRWPQMESWHETRPALQVSNMPRFMERVCEKPTTGTAPFDPQG